jgi:hypothetical protein
MHTHGGAETAIDLEDGERVEVADVLGLGEVRVGDNLISGRRFDAIPITGSELAVRWGRDSALHTDQHVWRALRDSG